MPAHRKFTSLDGFAASCRHLSGSGIAFDAVVVVGTSASSAVAAIAARASGSGRAFSVGALAFLFPFALSILGWFGSRRPSSLVSFSAEIGGRRR